MKNIKPLHDSQNGFSLIETLISLSLFLIIILACLEFFGKTRNIFQKLKDKEDTREAVLAALDRISTDLQQAGAGLIDPIHLELLEGFSEENGILIIFSREAELYLRNDLVMGQTRIQLENTDLFKKGRDICVHDSSGGEVKSVSSVDEESVVISSPLESSYIKDETSILLLRKISVFHDGKTRILRRRVNSSPSQPLLEEAAFFDFDLDKNANLIKLRIAANPDKEKIYEIAVFPKNTALAHRR